MSYLYDLNNKFDNKKIINNNHQLLNEKSKSK